MKTFEITFTSMRKVIIEVDSYESAEHAAEKIKQDHEEILMISQKINLE